MARIEERPVSAVVADILGNAKEIVRAEVRLVKAEIKKEAADAAIPVLRIACGFALVCYAVGLLLLAAVYLLSQRMPAWIAALVVCLVVLAIGVPLITSGRRRWKQLYGVPQSAAQNVKENATWMKAQIK